MSVLIKTAKRLKKYLMSEKPFVSFSRRINYVKTDKRICAMTFDDGPMLLPSSPKGFNNKPLTEVLLDILDSFGAKGTFDIIGDTSKNYPDITGKIGKPFWGGIKFDHYPDYKEDNMGGAVNSHELIKRMIDGEHTLSNHGFRHIIFGKKPLIYAKREHFESINEVISDIKSLNDYIVENFNYKITLGRPPHYVDKIAHGFSSYDAFSYLSMNYLGSSYDGGGWLPEKDIDSEVSAMVEPMRKLLEINPDALCGKIIFQKDGYNMAKRTPIAFALKEQLELLSKYNYAVVGTDKLLNHSQFSDVSNEHPLYEKFCALANTRPIAFSNNCIYPDKIMTKGEFALLISHNNQNLSSQKEALKEALSKTFTGKVNPSVPITLDDIKLYSNFFDNQPKSMRRNDIFEMLLL